MGQPHDYAKVAFDLIDDLDRLTEIDGVMSHVSATLAGFGYTSFLITGVPEPPQRLEPYILLNEWRKGWTEHYTRSNYYADDPVAAWCRRTVNPFEWSQAPFDAARWPRAAEVMAVAREFGLWCRSFVALDSRHASRWPVNDLTTNQGQNKRFTSSACARMHVVP